MTYQILQSGKGHYWRKPCKTCGEERLFRNYKCTVCGTTAAYVRKAVADLPVTTKVKQGIVWGKHMRRGKFAYQVKNDKADYFRRQAEASRAKFEGKS